ncbi:MAG: protein of unknown function DUF72 [Bacteroidetes bacterium]|nr:MAG: protein of unknown function DUF72 [Bacteroidota bacterium]
MDFGRLADITRVDFSLPPDDPANKAVLNTFSSKGQPRFFAGCPVWGEKEWLGLIYPQDARNKDLLKYYAQQFNCIELNTTFYRMPVPQTVTGWKNAVTKNFRFCPKIPREISHERRLINCRELTQVFCDVMGNLENHLGPFFLQLPPQFGPQHTDRLLEYAAAFPREYRLCVEFRNEQWFTDRHNLDKVFDAFVSMGTGTVITDTAGRRDALHQRLTTPAAFIRFTANDLHPTDFPRIDEWSFRLQEWIAQGLEEIYFFVHSPHHGKMPHLVNYAIQKLNENCGAALRPCTFTDTIQPELF